MVEAEYEKEAVPIPIPPEPPPIALTLPATIVQLQREEIDQMYITMMGICKAVWAETGDKAKRPWEEAQSERTKALLQERRQQIESATNTKEAIVILPLHYHYTAKFSTVPLQA